MREVLPRVGLWRSWERASMAWKRSSVRSRSGPPTKLISNEHMQEVRHSLLSVTLCHLASRTKMRLADYGQLLRWTPPSSGSAGFARPTIAAPDGWNGGLSNVRRELLVYLQSKAGVPGIHTP